MRKLPEGYLSEYLRAKARERQAMFQLGVLRVEFLKHEKKLLAQVEADHDLQGAAAGAGLRALGLDPEAPGRNFYVHEDGSVVETVDGKEVMPKELE